MKAWYAFLLLFCTQLPCFAQSDNNQPVKNIVSQKKYIDSVNRVADNIYLKSPDSARLMTERVLLLSEKIKYREGIARSYSNIGQVYWSQSYYPIALFYLNTALENAPKNNNLLLSEICSYLGRVYGELNDFKRSLAFLKRSEQLAGNDKSHLDETFADESFTYVQMHNYAKAEKTTLKSIQYSREANDPMGVAIGYSRQGDIYYGNKDYARALAYYDTSYRQNIPLKNNRLRANLYLKYAKVNNALHNYSKGMDYAQKGIALFDSIGNLTGLSKAYRAMIVGSEANNDLKHALYYERQYNHIQDSLNKIDKLRSTQLIQNYFALNEKVNHFTLEEKQDQENKEQLSFQHSFINILLVSLLMVIAALTVMFYFYQQKRRVSKKLQQQNQLIEAQAANLETVNSLKDKMFAVIGHDLRTPMSNLINIAAMFEAKDLSSEEVQMLMTDIAPVIRGAELTLSNLLDWAGSQIKGRTVQPLRLNLQDIGVEMEQTFHHLLKQKNISFTNEIESGQIIYADENHVKVILRNLISNAIKFTDVGGSIRLYTREKSGRIVVCVKDTGRGMTAEEIDRLFYLTTHFTAYGTKGEKGTGLGLILCRELVELNGGRLTVSSKSGDGSKFCVDLPLVK